MARHLGQIAQAGMSPPVSAGQRVIAEDFFTYNIQFEDIGFGVTKTGFIQIEADSDFLIQKLAYFSSIDGTPQSLLSADIPLCTILIVDTGSGRQIMNAPVPVGALFGDGRLPYILPTPKLFVKNSRINVTLFNFSVATEYDDIWINFEGKKIFTSG